MGRARPGGRVYRARQGAGGRGPCLGGTGGRLHPLRMAAVKPQPVQTHPIPVLSAASHPSEKFSNRLIDRHKNPCHAANMSGLRTYLAPLCLTLVLQAPPAFATEPPDPEWLASCTGRLSALMEHQFLTDGPASDQTRAQRDAMADLLAAVADPAAADHLLAVRIEAKWAYRALLTQAAFGPDPGHRAAQRAALLGQSCTALLLG